MCSAEWTVVQSEVTRADMLVGPSAEWKAAQLVLQKAGLRDEMKVVQTGV